MTRQDTPTDALSARSIERRLESRAPCRPSCDLRSQVLAAVEDALAAPPYAAAPVWPDFGARSADADASPCAIAAALALMVALASVPLLPTSLTASATVGDAPKILPSFVERAREADIAIEPTAASAFHLADATSTGSRGGLPRETPFQVRSPGALRASDARTILEGDF